MNRKFGIFAFFAFLFSMMLFRVVDDDGVGADDIGDFVIEDDEPESKQQAEQQEEPNVKPKEIEEIENKEIEELKAFKEELERERAVNEAVAELTEKYPSFDVNKIVTELQRIAKEEGEDKAEALNNPLGWENLYLTKFKKDEDDNTPAFDRGRAEPKEPFDFKKGYERAYSGDKQSIDALLENSKGM